ncbi:hypothetical protein MC7420_3407 [Coleofasciculus chthonoplastes PCC 7420]|uniref:Uncharacterized protein n=1 Tax=Coleofasciculus chthonoplastes PCC 7420 TaxID=118168 RepID=B4W3F6_9CYAN|nr:hypothetical protein MC7420_3407 [Coleofasciculus chthonoplastes PCC 7420]
MENVKHSAVDIRIRNCDDFKLGLAIPGSCDRRLSQSTPPSDRSPVYSVF